MDREALVRRNQRMTETMRKPRARHRFRDAVLAAIAKLPIPPSSAGDKRLLIIRPDHLGDVLLSTPAIQAIKRRHPLLRIDALCGEWSAEVVASYPEIDRVLTVALPGFKREASPPHSPWRLAWDTGRMLRRIGYSSAIVMRPDHWWGALVAFLAGIEQRVGYDVGNVAPFLTHAYALERRHALEQNLRLAEAWTGKLDAGDVALRYPVPAADADVIERRLKDWKRSEGAALICIHPGAGRRSKLWQPEKWGAVASELAASYDAAIVFTGTTAESVMIDDIVGRVKSKAIAAAGPTTIGQLAALYARSNAVLGPDSGALHLAAAVEAPTVALFGPADPAEFAPWGDPRRHAVVISDIGCRPCRILDWRDDDQSYHPCVREISVDSVLAAVDRLLSGPNT